MSSFIGASFLLLVAVSLFAWQIAIQVQVSNVDGAVPPLALLTTGVNRTVHYFQTSASPQYVSSSGIDVNSFLIVGIIDDTITLSGSKKSTANIFCFMTTTFTGDGVTAASLTINVGNTVFVIGGAPVNLPYMFGSVSNYVVGRLVGNSAIPSELTISFIPTNGTVTQNWSSIITIFTTDYT